MNEDYLWNKTGENAEIEKLENALKVFRYTETAPPAPPAKVFPFEAKTPRRFFRFSLAFATFAAILLVFVGAWFMFSNNRIEVAKNAAKIIAPQQIAEMPSREFDKKFDDAVSVKSGNLTITKINDSQPTMRRKAVKTTKFAVVKTPRNQTNTKIIEAQETAVKLTKEEKYAYDQLMLALSFTGSKLKLVKDKVEGIEEQNAVLEK